MTVKIRVVKQYRVTLQFKEPAWDEQDGIPYEVYAVSKSEAIKYVRKKAYNDGHTIGRGRYSLKAVEI